MRKKLLLILLLFIPFIINAKCNQNKHSEYVKLSSNITYDNDYSKSADRFTIIVYNIFDGMYIKYGIVSLDSDNEDKDYKKLNPDKENKVTISDIKPGTSVKIKIYADDGCEQIKTIFVDELYYNEYYGSSECAGYEKVLPVCSYQFYNVKVTKSLIETSKKYRSMEIQGETEVETDDTDDSLFSRIKDFAEKWGIKILLVVVTIFITSSIFSAKFRNIKHGI